MSRSRAKGTRWETAIVDYLRANGFPHVERRALSGASDRGDINLPGVVIEAKNANRYQLAEWADEARAETANAAADVGAVWLHRTGKASPRDAYVVLDGATFVKLLRLAGWGQPWEGNQP